MIRRIVFFIMVVFVILSLILFAIEKMKENPERILSKLPKEEYRIFNSDVELIYLVKYMYIIPAGEAVFEVDNITTFNDEEVYHLRAEARTGEFLSNFYKAKIVLQSFMDTEKLYTYKYLEDLYLPEGERRSKVVLYDQGKHTAQRKEYKMKILPDTQDPLSAIFYLRTRKFEPEKEFNINVLSKEENYEMKVKVLTKIDSIWHLEINVARQDRSSHHGGKFYVWISDDERKLPVLIKAMTKAGPVTLRLVSINSK